MKVKQGSPGKADERTDARRIAEVGRVGILYGNRDAAHTSGLLSQLRLQRAVSEAGGGWGRRVG